MNRRSQLRNAFGLALGLVFLPWAMAQQAAPPADLPSAESILDRYVEVTGGAAAYKRRTSEVTTGTLQIVAAGLTGQLKIFVKPGLQRTTIEIPGVGLIESGVKDGVVWESNPVTGPRIVDGLAAELTASSARPGATAYWREVYASVETTGIEDVDGEPAYRVVHTFGKGGSLPGFYSVESGLLVKLEISAAPPIAQVYEEWSEVDGIRLPRRVVTTSAGQRSIINFTSLESNVEIPDERFALPEAVQALLK